MEYRMENISVRHKILPKMFSETRFMKLSVGLPICDEAEAFFSPTEPALLLSIGERVNEIFFCETPVGLNAVVAAVVKKDVTTVCGFMHVTCENKDQRQLAENRTAVNLGLP